MNIIQPPFLERGDTIGIAATARKVNINDLQFAIQYIQNKGYNLLLSSNIYSEYHQLAGDDTSRTQGFQELLNNSEVKAVLIARGGYGTVRIIDNIDFSKFKKHPKWLCGFSDITVIHSHVFNLGFKTIHATMPVLFSQSEIATESLFNLLEGKMVTYPVPLHPLNKKGYSEGILVGGNLSVLYSLMGTVSQINFKDKILFIEDVDEYLYHIDRMMMQLKRCGILKYLNGLIVGGFTDMEDNTVSFGKTAEEIISESVKEYDYPVCFNFPAGHIKENLAFIHGQKIKLEVSSEVKIHYS